MPDVAFPVRERLRNVWLFAELSEAELDELERVTQRRTFHRGSIIVQQGDSADTNFYCVHQGHLKVTTCDANGSELWINLLRPGCHVGEIALLDGKPRSATVTGLDRGELLSIRHADFHRLVKTGLASGVGMRLLRTMATRVRHLTDRVHDSGALPVFKRVAKQLNELADLVGTHVDAKRVILNVKLSQQDLGDMVHATRESVNKCMRALANKGIIRRTGGRIDILDRPRLRALIAA